MLKGKSKIELFDALSGAKCDEYVNPNIITNAVNNVLNMNDKLGFIRKTRGTANTSELVTANPLLSAMPLATKAFGGVLLFGSTISENVNTIMPPANVDCIGYAGGSYAGSDVYKGSRNAAESGYILDDNQNIVGYRHVWDFGTDKANGTIASLGLTSEYGGNFGIKANLSDMEQFPFNANRFSSADSVVSMMATKNILNFSISVPMTVFYAALNANDTITVFAIGTDDNIWKVTLAPTKSISITQSENEIVSMEILVSGIHDSALSNIYVYNNLIHELYFTNTTTLVHKTYTFEGTLQTTVTITLPSVAAYMYGIGKAFYFNNAYYYRGNTATTYNVLNKIDDDGVLQTTITLPITSSIYGGIVSVRINESLGIVEALCNTNVTSVSGNSICYHVFMTIDSSDNVHITSSASPNYYSSNSRVTSSAIHDQLIRLAENDCAAYISQGKLSTSPEASIAINAYPDMRYLASINNLSRSVVKTPAQTMKITYELMEV